MIYYAIFTDTKKKRRKMPACDKVGVKGLWTHDIRASFATRAFWDLALTLRSEKGLSYTSKNHHDFAVIVAGPEACSRTAQALGEATQDLITKACPILTF